MANLEPITVKTTVNAPIDTVWKSWTEPEHIMAWSHASDDWHAPKASNDLRTGGTFSTTMAAKDGSVEFEFGGTYTNVEDQRMIEYTMSDGRKVSVAFEADGDKTHVTETFDPESENPREMQQDGWQAILNNFASYTESL